MSMHSLEIYQAFVKLKIMPGKFFLILFFIFCFFCFYHTSVWASPTPGPGQTTCDLCGWCDPTANPTPPSNWQQCYDCLYPTTTPGVRQKNKDSYYTILGCISTEPGIFVKNILQIVLGIAGGIAFLGFLGGAGTVLTSAGNPEQLQSGKDAIMSSLLGLLLIIFSVFLLRVVGFDILKIPGFG